MVRIIPWSILAGCLILAAAQAGEEVKTPEPRPAGNRGERRPPAELAAYFQPPEKYPIGLREVPLAAGVRGWRRGQDARGLATPPAEILDTWQGIMGPWPALIESPRVDTVDTTRRENLTQHRLRLGIALGGETVEGLLLLPDGKGPFPAVLVVDYTAQTSVGLGSGERATMVGNSPSGASRPCRSANRPQASISASRARPWVGPYLGPVGKAVRIEPLSALAYAAANSHTVLSRRLDVLPERIGIVGHSFGGKWAMFASCLYDKFACAAWSDTRHRVRRGKCSITP